MPRTRLELEREAKVAEILEAAEQRLRKGGYEALSVAGIARELEVAQNAIYWYFPSKDHLFVATLDRMLREIVARKPPRRQTIERKVLWFIDQLQEIEHVRAAMYERARVSPVVADFVNELALVWRRMLANALASRLPEAELTLAADALLATIQGAFLQPVGADERKRLVAYALRRLTAPSPDGDNESAMG